MEIHVVYEDHKFGAEIEYIFEIFFNNLSLKYKINTTQDFNASALNNSDLMIYYGSSHALPNGNYNRMHVSQADFFGDLYLTANSLPNLPLDYLAFNDERLPILYQASEQPQGLIIYSSEKNQALITVDDELGKRSVFTNFDFLAACIFYANPLRRGGK